MQHLAPGPEADGWPWKENREAAAGWPSALSSASPPKAPDPPTRSHVGRLGLLGKDPLGLTGDLPYTEALFNPLIYSPLRYLNTHPKVPTGSQALPSALECGASRTKSKRDGGSRPSWAQGSHSSPGDQRHRCIFPGGGWEPQGHFPKGLMTPLQDRGCFLHQSPGELVCRQPWANMALQSKG